MKNLSFVFIVLLSLTFFNACKQDDTVDPDPQGKVAPELPAPESFVMPFNGFEDADTSGLVRNSSNSRTIPTFHNWFYSASNVVVWNTVLTVSMAVPVLAFYESFNHTAEYQGDGVWLWTYTVTDNGQSYTAELYGELLASQEVKWDMYVSQANGWSDVLWYSGVTANDGSYATWTLNHQPNNPKPFIGIEYQRDNGNGVGSIRYTNIIPNNPDNGDYIEYREGAASGASFNRAYDVYQINADNLLQIQWNKPTNEGRVKNPNHFQDEDWHCWDSNLHDTEC